MPYYDIFIAPIAADKRRDYDTFVRETHAMIRGFGATELVDVWPDDVQDGTLTSLPMAVKLEPGEVVTAGWIVWPTKEVRDAGWAKMMSEETEMDMPFDGKRMIFGGFTEMLVTRA